MNGSKPAGARGNVSSCDSCHDDGRCESSICMAALVAPAEPTRCQRTRNDVQTLISITIGFLWTVYNPEFTIFSCGNSLLRTERAMPVIDKNIFELTSPVATLTKVVLGNAQSSETTCSRFLAVVCARNGRWLSTEERETFGSKGPCWIFTFAVLKDEL